MFKSGLLGVPGKIGLLLAVLIGILVSALEVQPGKAQSDVQIQLTLSKVDSSQFPNVRFYLEAYDDQGNFLTDITPSNINILEDGYVCTVNKVSRIEPGLQIILAVNEAPNLGNHSNGVSYFSRIHDNLLQWADQIPATTVDDFSLSTNSGLPAARLKSGQELKQVLEAYNPDLLVAKPGMVSLSQALDLATDPNPNPLMKRTILFITTIPNQTLADALPSMTERAAQLGVRVFIWLVDPSIASHAVQAEPLLIMAEQTGGKMFTFSGSEDLPDLNLDLEALRYRYEISFLSQNGQSGEHKFTVSLQKDGLQVTSEPLSYAVEVLPPSPMFLDLPAGIERTWTQPEGSDEPILGPQSATLEALVEFPDGYTRELKAARLYVDDQLVAENTTAPFTTFTWPLAAYLESASHQLRIEVEDSLGIKQTSITSLVDVQVMKRPLNLWQTIWQKGYLAGGAAALLAAGVLAFALLSTNRKWHQRRQKRIQQKREEDPLTQSAPVTNLEPLRRKSRSASDVTLTIRRSDLGLPDAPAPARLIRLSARGNLQSEQFIPLYQQELTFGRDPQQAVCVLDSTSVDQIHARLCRSNDGVFILQDIGSMAGTWVNYQMIPAAGKCLQHGDVIHMGLESFRFELNHPLRIRQPKISIYEEE